MVFQLNLGTELHQAVLEPPPQSISPKLLDYKVDYEELLVRLSQENPKRYWMPLKYLNKLPDGQWECEITMSVFHPEGSSTQGRKIASHKLEDAVEMAASGVYHDLLLDFFESCKSSITPVTPPVGPQIGVWNEKRSVKKTTKAEHDRLLKAGGTRGKPTKKQENESNVEIKRREKTLKSQQRLRDSYLGRIDVRERRLERKLAKWNARIQNSKGPVNTTAIPEYSEVVKARSDLTAWKGTLEDFNRLCEVENAEHLCHLTLDEHKLPGNVNTPTSHPMVRSARFDPTSFNCDDST